MYFEIIQTWKKSKKNKKTLAHPYIISSVRPLNNLTLTFSATNCLFTATALEGFVYRNGPRQWPFLGIHSCWPSLVQSWSVQGSDSINLCRSRSWICLGTSAEPPGSVLAGERLQACQTHSTIETKTEWWEQKKCKRKREKQTDRGERCIYILSWMWSITAVGISSVSCFWYCWCSWSGFLYNT